MGGACLVLAFGVLIWGHAKSREPESEEPKLAPKAPNVEIPNVPVYYSNNKRIRIKYQCNEVGRSGVSRVDLWSTRDGKQWREEGYNKLDRGDVIFQAQEDGRYGLTVIATSGAKINPKSPQAGDYPQRWVEIDTVPPQVQLFQPILGMDAKGGKVMFRWSATDKNFGPEPISLYYSESRDGPWKVIIDAHANRGEYVWYFPKDAPLRVYFQIKAIDRAGNKSVCKTDQPLVLDPAEPRAIVTGIEPALDETSKPPDDFPVKLPPPPAQPPK
ncbi:MAG TPA: hypothetical protein VKS79_03285 [Gemmataceae bacterium]|nr:hypothetical protein [Gemmataceae bacterium]